ncbi:MAG: hypothetical protein QOE15_2382 [Acidimicrobiaceae bacterium]|nr:hypothetical protein [Acidimicrobiaceae bacterium]
MGRDQSASSRKLPYQVEPRLRRYVCIVSDVGRACEEGEHSGIASFAGVVVPIAGTDGGQRQIAGRGAELSSPGVPDRATARFGCHCGHVVINGGVDPGEYRVPPGILGGTGQVVAICEDRTRPPKDISPFRAGRGRSQPLLA